MSGTLFVPQRLAKVNNPPSNGALEEKTSAPKTEMKSCPHLQGGAFLLCLIFLLRKVRGV